MEKEFRSWAYMEKVMLYGEDVTGAIINGKPDYPTNEIYMQYIGIKDMNDKKIFEGDILTYGMLSVAKNSIIVVPGRKIMTEIKLTFAVEWDYKLLLQIQQITESTPDLEHVEIVGNIYENPDILEDLKNAGNN